MNKVILIGRLAADPEIRTTNSGTKVATYRLAVDRRKKADGTQEADFLTCVAWDKAASFAQQYLTKGRKIAVEGRLQSRTYDAQDGSKRSVVEIIVESHEFCDSKPASGNQTFTPATGATAQQAAELFGRQPEYVDDDELPF